MDVEKIKLELTPFDALEIAKVLHYMKKNVFHDTEFDELYARYFKTLCDNVTDEMVTDAYGTLNMLSITKHIRHNGD